MITATRAARAAADRSGTGSLTRSASAARDGRSTPHCPQHRRARRSAEIDSDMTSCGARHHARHGRAHRRCRRRRPAGPGLPMLLGLGAAVGIGARPARRLGAARLRPDRALRRRRGTRAARTRARHAAPGPAGRGRRPRCSPAAGSPRSTARWPSGSPTTRRSPQRRRLLVVAPRGGIVTTAAAAVNLSASFAEMGRDVLLVEADLRTPTLTERLRTADGVRPGWARAPAARRRRLAHRPPGPHRRRRVRALRPGTRHTGCATSPRALTSAGRHPADRPGRGPGRRRRRARARRALLRGRDRAGRPGRRRAGRLRPARGAPRRPGTGARTRRRRRRRPARRGPALPWRGRGRRPTRQPADSGPRARPAASRRSGPAAPVYDDGEDAPRARGGRGHHRAAHRGPGGPSKSTPRTGDRTYASRPTAGDPTGRAVLRRRPGRGRAHQHRGARRRRPARPAHRRSPSSRWSTWSSPSLLGLAGAYVGQALVLERGATACRRTACRSAVAFTCGARHCSAASPSPAWRCARPPGGTARALAVLGAGAARAC